MAEAGAGLSETVTETTVTVTTEPVRKAWGGGAVRGSERCQKRAQGFGKLLEGLGLGIGRLEVEYLRLGESQSVGNIWSCGRLERDL